MTIDEFHRLPRNSAYKYEYLDGEAYLSPRPKTFNGLLDLTPVQAPATLRVFDDLLAFRRITGSDWEKFPELFAAAFDRVQPFMSLSESERLEASRECLNQTRTGGDGPLIEQACFAAAPESEEYFAGAILITLIPREAEGEWWDGKWDEAPATDDARRLLGRPHLTWIFVAPLCAGHGLGSALLAHSTNALLGLRRTRAQILPDLGSM
jgi:GNAT superfamily N-acetyltransferase